MRITHVVVTDAFAGTERYVCEVARRQAVRGHDVLVIGGSPARMPTLVGAAHWQRAGTVAHAVAHLIAAGRRDVVHTHLSQADVAAALAGPAHRALLVSTRHIAARRGRSLLGRLSVPIIEHRVRLEIAISHYVAAALAAPPDVVLHNGVANSDTTYDSTSRSVLVLQRLEPEKDTATALRAWAASGLATDGWWLNVAGDGSERPNLAAMTRASNGVNLLGVVEDVQALLSKTAMLLAPAPSEPLGLSVLEAMAAGVPVVVAAAGGHLETVPTEWPWAFAAGDAEAGAVALRSLALDPAARSRASESVRAHQREFFDVERHVDTLLDLYESRAATRQGPMRKR